MSDEPILTHWKQLVDDQRFIGVYALPNGGDMIVTIDFAQPETLTMEGGKKEEKRVLYLVGQKPLILNKTNGTTIEGLYTPYVENWRGKRITLYASTTKLGKDMVQCLRIRNKVPPLEKEPLAPARFTKALAGIKAGTYAAATLRDKFALSLAQEAELAAAEQEPAA
jgi:hypothetical protein